MKYFNIKLPYFIHHNADNADAMATLESTLTAACHSCQDGPRAPTGSKLFIPTATD